MRNAGAWQRVRVEICEEPKMLCADLRCGPCGSRGSVYGIWWRMQVGLQTWDVT